MKFNTFLYKILQSNIRKYILFLLSAVFSMSTFFIFANLWFTDSFRSKTNGPMHSLMVIAASITILFATFIISYVHWYLIKERVKSFAVLLSYGMLRKELRKLIILETLIIYVVSLVLAFLTGSVFSRLFFMISVKLLSIDASSITYQLTYESFLSTAIVFFVIFFVVLLLALVRIAKKDIVELSKASSNVELNKKGSFLLGILGILLLVISMVALYLHNRGTTEKVGQWILGCAMVCLIGTYLVISHFSRLLYAGLKRNPKKYYDNILEASEFALSYRQNRKTLFVLTLLTIGIIIFASVTYTLDREAYHITDIESPQDLSLQKIDALDVISDNEMNTILSNSDITITENKVLPFIYMKAPDMNINNWRQGRYAPVVNEEDFNACFHTKYEVAQGEAIQIIFESKIDQTFHYFGDQVHLENNLEKVTLKSSRTVYNKILNRYMFTQGVLLIVDRVDYQRFYKEAADIERGKTYLYQFDNWKKSQSLCDQLETVFYDNYDKLTSQDSVLCNKLIDRYGYAHLQLRSKIGYYRTMKMQGSFSLFIMGFVSILFVFCILITYNFKVFMNASEDKVRLKKLDGIGMRQHEKEKLIKIRIRLLMFVPTLLGILIGICWCFSLNLQRIIEIDLSNFIILDNAIVTGGIFLGIIIITYQLLKSSYLQRIGCVKE